MGGLLLALLFASGCASAGRDTAIVVPPTEEFGGPEFSLIIVSTDLAVGNGNRLSFGVLDREGMPVRASQAEIRTYFFPEGQDERQPRGAAVADFQQWNAAAGIFITNLDFDTAGLWELEADLTAAGASITAASKFTVKETSDTPSIGAPAPASVTLTAADVDDLSHISTANPPDPDFYQLSLHEALDQGKPFVVVFATPAFCVSATCGPQLSELGKVKEQFEGRANFVHVEVFKDPHLITGGRPTAGLVPAVEEWGLPTEPWVFVVDARGLISAKFEQFTPAGAIVAALSEALGAV